MNRLVLVIGLAGLCLVTGCATPRANLPINPRDFAAPDAPKPISVSADYRIGPLDTVAVTVFQVENLSGTYQVDPTGHLSLPLIGEVPAQGLTTRELGTLLQQRYGDRYLKSPEIQVSLKEAMSQRVTVDGSVRQPGVFPIAGQTTLLQAISMARGLDDYANAKRTVVFREINGKRQAAAFDLSQIRAGLQPDPAVYGNDVIVVDGSNVRRSYRDIIQAVPLLAIFLAL